MVYSGVSKHLVLASSLAFHAEAMVSWYYKMVDEMWLHMTLGNGIH